MSVEQSRVVDVKDEPSRFVRRLMIASITFVSLLFAIGLLGLSTGVFDQYQRRQATIAAIVRSGGHVRSELRDEIAAAPEATRSWLTSIVNVKQIVWDGPAVSDREVGWLADFNELDMLSLDYTNVTSDGVKSLPKASRLNHLRLRSTRLDDGALPKLADYPELQMLQLDHNDITDTGIANLPSLPRLGYLSLSETSITGAGFATSAGSSKTLNLYGLELNDTKVNDAGLLEIAASTRLTYLQLDRTDISDAGLKALSALKNLRHLHVAGTNITDVGLVTIAKFGDLMKLELADTEVTDAGLIHLKGCSRLEELNLANTQVTDAGLEHLLGIPSLRSVNLTGTRVTDSGMSVLAKLPELEELRIVGTAITIDGFKAFDGNASLSRLTVPKSIARDDLPQSLPILEFSAQ